MTTSNGNSRAPLIGRPGATKGRTDLRGEILSAEEIAAIKRATNRGATGLRNRALITVMHRAGLRISEALALRPSDYDPTTGEIRIHRGKGGKGRTSGMGAGACAVLDAWMAKRVQLGFRNGTIFCQLDGQPLTAQAVREMLKRAAVKADIGKRVHPHAFRHAFAADLVRKKVTMPSIQKLLGHSNLGVTSRYLGALTGADAVSELRGAQADDED